MKKKRAIVVCVGIFLFSGCALDRECRSPSSPESEPPRSQASNSAAAVPVASAPRLILWMTVDQMRGEYFERYSRHFVAGGFRRLFERGFWFQNAHYAHAITETAPGHATLFTGASPRIHGIIGNSWLDEQGQEIASVSDEEAVLIGPGVSSDQGANQGASPRRLLVPTLADSVIQSTKGVGKAIALSLKDRGAILPAGRGGMAIWLGPAGFVTSDYYTRTAPVWLDEYHRSHQPSQYLRGGWELLLPEERYLNQEAHTVLSYRGMGPHFPHTIPAEAFGPSALKKTPFGDTALLDLARTVVQREGLGRDDAVDLLSLSLSSTDYIGHYFGPESREFEDQLVRLDRQLAAFFDDLKEWVDEDRILFVLSADHGGCESPEHLRELGLVAGRLTEGDVAGWVAEALEQRFGHQRFLRAVVSPYVYLDHQALRDAGQDPAEVRRLVASALQLRDSIFDAIDAASLSATTSQGPVQSAVAEAIFPQRSGDIYVVPSPHVSFVQDADLAATHGSPWEYDSHVPLVLSGSGVPTGSSRERVDVRSLAPTVALLASVLPPAGSLVDLLPGVTNR